MFKVKRFFLFFLVFIFFLSPCLTVKSQELAGGFVEDVTRDVEIEVVKFDDQEDVVLTSEASLVPEEPFNIYLDHNTILKGYTVSAFNDYIKLSLVPGILSDDTRVLVEKIPEEEMEFPWQAKRISSVVQFEFLNKKAYDDHHPFYIQFSYDESSGDYKQVFFYDKGLNLWRPLPTKDFPDEKFVRSLIHLPYARVAVFSFPRVEVLGQASWYKYKNGNFTASTVYPKGSLLRVYNQANKKYVDVVVNDYGPERNKFPNRILDLDYEAFKKIANQGEGVIDVLIEPLSIVKNSSNELLNIGLGINSQPQIKSLSAILIKESGWEVVYEKNADQQSPVASLTKLLSMLTFFSDEKNEGRLNEVVKYSLQDENYNHKYFNKWEVARIELKNGDELSVKDLLYSSLVRSANNTVETLARESGLGRDNFIKKMNDIVAELGLSSSVFFEPTGLDKNNVSTAREYALIAKTALDKKVIAEASVASKYQFYTRNDNALKLRYNSSDLVLNNNYPDFRIVGSKTGYIDASSGYCLVTRIDIAGEKYIAVILNSSSRDQSFAEMLELLNFAVFNSKK